MLHIALYQPEIPPNTGNIIRLCANSGAQLHLIKPLGFTLDDKQLKRAGLDYHEYANLQLHDNYSNFQQCIDTSRLFACSTKGKTRYDQVSFQANDVLLFGPETRGLPQEVLTQLPPRQVIRLPMLANSRSLNLSNACAIILYEAWRQLGFN
jgi:tRNA (cytidine/uridine-2'-O-)-methyltransferase